MERILILFAAQDVAQAEPALRSARENAMSAERVSYGLSLACEPEEAELAVLRDAGVCRFLVPGASPWADADALWQGENYLLLATPEMRFEHHWDMRLIRALRACSREKSAAPCALTGFPPLPSEPVRAMSPVAADGFNLAGQLCFHRGTPLLHAARSMRSAFINPAFCFMPASFLQVLHADLPPFLEAFAQGCPLFTLHDPAVSLELEQPVPSCEITGEAAADPVWARFEKRFGLLLATRQLSAMARLGIFDPSLDFPRRVPLPLQAQEAVCRLLRRWDETTPMCVTAFLPMKQPPRFLMEEYFLWFTYLARLHALPLTCYTDSSLLRRVSVLTPGVLEYKPRYGLPGNLTAPEDGELNRFLLSKPFLLHQAKETFVGQSHFLWTDFGYLRYPAWEKSSMNWDTICQETIVLATVEDVPDTSMIVVPRGMLDELCAEVLRLCEADAAQGLALPDETLLWQTLMQLHPAWFAPIALPARRQLLSLTMLSREEAFHGIA